METQSSRISGLENEVRALRAESDRFRRLFMEAEGEAEKRRSAYFELEKQYAEERSKRIKLELSLADALSFVPHRNNEITQDLLSSNTVDAHTTLQQSTEIEPATPTISSSAGTDVMNLRTPPKHIHADAPETKVTVKLSSSPRKPKLELISPDKKRKRIPTRDDSKEKQEPESSSRDQPSTKRQRRPVNASSRLPITMAERQASSTSSDPSRSSASTSGSQTSRSKAPSKRAMPEDRSMPPVSPETPAIRHDRETSAQDPTHPSSASSFSRTPGYIAQRRVTPSESLPSAAASAICVQDAAPVPLIRRPKPVVRIPNDRKKAEAESGFTLDQSEVFTYLANAFDLPVNPPPLDVQVSRRALSHKFGLPGMGFLWKSKSRLLKFLLPTLQLNPAMPRSPGAPGLLLTYREAMLNEGPWTLLIKVENSKKVRLNYAGEYTCQKVGIMAKEEFAAQNQEVKEGWGKKIASHKKFPVYRALRARITLRKRLGTEPTDKQIAEESSLISSKNYHSSLSDVDVVAAFERGDESISVVRLECSSYSHERAKELIEAQEAWERSERENAHPPPNERKSKSKSDGQSKLRKKQVQDVVSSSSEDEFDELDESSDES